MFVAILLYMVCLIRHQYNIFPKNSRIFIFYHFSHACCHHTIFSNTALVAQIIYVISCNLW